VSVYVSVYMLCMCVCVARGSADRDTNVRVVIYRAFFFLLHNHIMNIKKRNFLFPAK
jgi:hypothetical protein